MKLPKPGVKGRPFLEALAWFRKRTPLTDAEVKADKARALKVGFFVSRVESLAMVVRLHNALTKAIAEGTTLADFKAEARAAALPEGRPELVFRNALQRAYSVGRYQQATHPDVLDDRPFWLFDGIDDAAQSAICKACDGTILPADDPWWNTHIAPLHHGCRSSHICLTAEEAEARGITTKKPSAKPAKGFGDAPTEEDFSWATDKAAEAPAPLRKIAKAKLSP